MSVHGMMNYVLVGVQLNKYHSVNSSCTLCVCVCVCLLMVDLHQKRISQHVLM